MSYVFFPSCKVTAAFPEPSKKLAAYLYQKLHITPIGCCRSHHQQLTSKDTALVICNNCAAIIDESAHAGKLLYVWEIIDQDPDFIFPNYQGETMTIRDCWLAAQRQEVQQVVRALLRKMHIHYLELADNFAKAPYCGANLLEPATESNKKLAPVMYLQRGKALFQPHSKEEQIRQLQKQCANITTEKVVCYCRPCTAGIIKGGKKGLHLIELLFPAN